MQLPVPPGRCAVSALQASKASAGWWNRCTRLVGPQEVCGGRYWVRSADGLKDRATRYVDETCSEVHVCRVAAIHDSAAAAADGEGGSAARAQVDHCESGPGDPAQAEGAASTSAPGRPHDELERPPAPCIECGGRKVRQYWVVGESEPRREICEECGSIGLALEIGGEG